MKIEISVFATYALISLIGAYFTQVALHGGKFNPTTSL